MTIYFQNIHYLISPIFKFMYLFTIFSKLHVQGESPQQILLDRFSLTLEPYRTFPPPREPYRCCGSVTNTKTHGEQMLWRGMLPSLRERPAHGSGFPPFRSQDQRRGRPIMVIIPRPHLFGNSVGGFEKALRICNKIIYHTVPGLKVLVRVCKYCFFYVLYPFDISFSYI